MVGGSWLQCKSIDPAGVSRVLGLTQSKCTGLDGSTLLEKGFSLSMQISEQLQSVLLNLSVNGLEGFRGLLWS